MIDWLASPPNHFLFWFSFYADSFCISTFPSVFLLWPCPKSSHWSLGKVAFPSWLHRTYILADHVLPIHAVYVLTCCVGYATSYSRRQLWSRQLSCLAVPLMRLLNNLWRVCKSVVFSMSRRYRCYAGPQKRGTSCVLCQFSASWSPPYNLVRRFEVGFQSKGPWNTFRLSRFPTFALGT